MHEKIFGRANQWLENLGISTFSIFLGIALVVLVYYFIYLLEKKRGYSREKTNRFLTLLAIALVITYLFAMFFDALFHGFKSGGITFIAGFLGGVIAFVVLIYYFMKEERKNIYSILNLIIPAVILAHAIGRLGCFSVGCCYGTPTDSIFGVYFPKGTNPYELGEFREPIHPTQLYEAFFLVGLFFVLKLKFFRNNEFSYYLIFYGIFRFLIEVFLRGDDRGLIFGVAPSAILSIVMLLMGIGILIYNKFFKVKLDEEVVM